MEVFPLRHRNHEIEKLSENYLNCCIPESWIINPIKIDYGTDFNCEIAINQKVTGNNFSIQLKGKETERNANSVKISIKRSTITRWLKRLEPTMLIAYVVDEKEAFWMWFKDETVDLTLNNQQFTISIPKSNKLSNVDWSQIAEHVANIFSRRHWLYKEPIINQENENAWKLFYEDKFEKALPILYELSNANPNDTSLLQAISISEYKLFNYSRALVSIIKALEIDNNSHFQLIKASILTEIGCLNDDKNKIREALDIYKEIEDEGYLTYEFYYNYGSAFSKIEEYETSIKYFQRAIFINPNQAEAWNNMGNSYMLIGNHLMELLCYENALRINPNLAECLFSKGSTLFRYFGNVDEGLPLMLEATKKSNRFEIDNPNVFFWIAEAYLSKKDFISSEEWNKRGLRFFSSNKHLMNQKERIQKRNKNNS